MTDDNGNGRITMAILGTKVDTLIDEVRALRAERSVDHDRLLVVEHCALENAKDVLHNRQRLDSVDVRDKTWNGLNSLAVMIAAGLAWWGGGQ